MECLTIQKKKNFETQESKPLLDFEIEQDFINNTQKVLFLKIDKFDRTKIKNSYLSKEREKQAADGKKIKIKYIIILRLQA